MPGAAGAIAGAVAGPLISGALNGSADVGGGYGIQAQAARDAQAANAAAVKEAIDQLNKSYGQARTDSNQYYNIGQSTLAPYKFTGFNALDALSDQLGITRPQSSFQLNQLLSKKAGIDAASQSQNGDLSSQIDKYMPGAQHMAQVLGGGAYGGSGNAGTDILKPEGYSAKLTNDTSGLGGKLDFLKAVSQRVKEYADAQSNLPEHSAYRDANYDAINKLYDDYQKSLTAPTTSPFTPEEQAQLDAYNNGTMQGVKATPTQGLSAFLNTPEYQLLFGGSGKAVDPNASPLDRFQSSPGYQFQMDQGIKARDASAAAKGMLLSGNHQQELTSFGQGLANQDYNNYENRLQGTYGNYYNRLAGVAGLGANMNSQSANTSQNQGNTLANMSMNQGNNLASMITGRGAVDANSILAAGNANASGYAAQQNQLGQTLGGFAGPLTNLAKGFMGGGATGGSWLNPDTMAMMFY
jgi:hypothetical protein